MVTAAAFLIICVILFGLESVRSFVFGTFGFLAWAVIIVLGIWAVLAFINGIEKDIEDAKKEKQKRIAEKEEYRKNNPTEYAETKKANKIFVICVIAFWIIFAGLIAALIVSVKNK